MDKQRPRCPGCGANMEPLRVPRYCCNTCGWLSGYRRTWEDAYDAAMLRWQEPNRVLTADELAKMNGDPVFVQQGDGEEFWAMIEDGAPIIGECDPDFQNMTMSPPLVDPAGHFGLHVLGWRALLRRPTDEECAAAPWGAMPAGGKP